LDLRWLGVALPPRTPGQRAAALEKAAAARRERAKVSEQLKSGFISLPQVLASGQTNEIVGKMKVSAVLESLPGIGKVRARQVMEGIGIPESRRVRGLGRRQRAALTRWSEDRSFEALDRGPAEELSPGRGAEDWGSAPFPEADAAPDIEDWDRP
jgi:hypothetical protein